jgi:hypothetical protein
VACLAMRAKYFANAKHFVYRGPNDDEARKYPSCYCRCSCRLRSIVFTEDNLDLFSHIFALSLDGRLYLAPIDQNPQRVLDIGLTPSSHDDELPDYVFLKPKQAQELGFGPSTLPINTLLPPSLPPIFPQSSLSMFRRI